MLGDLNELGIPIGNYTSQFFANIYLNELDHYVKEEIKVHYYARYMDDFIFLLKDKREAKEVLDKIKEFVSTKLELKLNKKTCYFPNNKGIDFCGYKIYETHILLRKRSIKKVKKTINYLNSQYSEDKLNMNEVVIKLSSFKAHSKHANTYNMRMKLYNGILFKNEKIIKLLL